MKGRRTTAKSVILLVVCTIGLSVAVVPQQSPFGDKLTGFTESPTEHIINEVDDPFVVRSIKGRIGDPIDYPLPNVLFEIRGPGKDKTIKRTHTDDQGRFKIGNVAPGTYRFKATRGAFQSVIGTLIVSKKANKSSEINIRMPFGV